MENLIPVVIPSLSAILMIIAGPAFLISIVRGIMTKNFTMFFYVLGILAVAFLATKLQFQYEVKYDQKLSLQNLIVEQKLMLPEKELCEAKLLEIGTWGCIVTKQSNDLVNRITGSLTDGTESAVKYLMDNYLFQIRTENLYKLFDSGIFISALSLSVYIYGICFSLALIHQVYDVLKDKDLQFSFALLRQRVFDIVTIPFELIILPILNLSIILAFAHINSLSGALINPSFMQNFKLDGASNMLGLGIIVYLLFLVSFLILAVTHIIANVTIVMNTLKTMWAVAISPLSKNAHTIPIKDTIATCLAIIFSKYCLLISFLFVDKNIIASLVIISVGLWSAIKLKAFFNEILQNYMVNFDLSTMAALANMGSRIGSGISRHLNNKEKVGEEKVRSYSHSFEGDFKEGRRRGYTYRNIPILQTNKEKYINSLRGFFKK